MHTIGARMHVGPSRNRHATKSTQHEVHVNNFSVETKAMTGKIREMEKALAVKTSEAVDTS